jgi:hypothetical protein
LYSFPSLTLPRLGLLALLAHSTISLLASLVLRADPRRTQTIQADSPWARVDQLFTHPLRQAALASSFLCVPLLFSWAQGEMTSLAFYAGWLAVLWLAVAWTQRWPILFTAFQAAVSLAVLYGVTAWLESQEWVRHDYPAALRDPRSLQAYGVGLGVLCLLWSAARVTLRSNLSLRQLWEPGGLALDRALLAALVLGQLILACWGIMPGIIQELTPVDVAPNVSAWPVVHSHAVGAGAWVLLATLALTVGMRSWEGQPAGTGLGAVVLAVTMPVLVAGRFGSELATASALRWGLTLTLLAGTAVLRREAGRARRLLFACCLVPVLGLTVLSATRALQGRLPTGPAADSLFASLGWAVSYAVPLVLISLVLAEQAWHRRSAGYAFAAGLVVTLAASVVVESWHLGEPLGRWWIPFVQANVIASSMVALLWLAARQRIPGYFAAPPVSVPLLGTQVCLGLLGNGVLLLPVLVHLFLRPGQPLPAELAEAGLPWGWLALVAALASAFWYSRQAALFRWTPALGVVGLALGILAAGSTARGEQGDWLAYHLLTAAWIVTGVAVLVADSKRAVPDPAALSLLRWPYSSLSLWTEMIGLGVVVLALRGAWADPARPWWSAGATLAVSALAGILALRARLERYTYISGLLVNLAGTILWIAWGPWTATGFAYTQVICAAAAAALWCLLQRALPMEATPLRWRGRWPPFSHAAVTAGLWTMGVVIPLELAGPGRAAGGALAWTALVALIVALVVCLWDSAAGFTLGGLYAAGLFAIGLTLHSSDLPAPNFGRMAALLLAGHVLLASLLQRAQALWTRLGHTLRLPARPAGWPVAWFLPTQTIAGGVVVSLSLGLALGWEGLLPRLAGPLAVVILLMAALVHHALAPDSWRSTVRGIALGLGVVVAAELGWALLGPTTSGLWLNRSVLLLLALTVLSVAYGVGLPRVLSRLSAWADSARQMGPVLGVLASVVLLAVLGQELLLYDAATRRTPMAWPAVVTVLAALLTSIVASVWFAVRQGRDPFGISGPRRRLYVYAAELGLALLFVHVRLNVPELFRGLGARHWALLIMAVAFTGAGLGELFRRRNLPVLAGPLQQTGVFLPLLPLLVFWARPPAALYTLADQSLPGLRPLLDSLERLPREFDHHALLWFLLGLLYACLAVAQRSFRWALVAALAGNFGLWAFLAHAQLYFWIHPQVWLIPTALIILTAEHLNRDRLTSTQSTTLRYVGLMVLYLSSTADLFLTGLGNSILLPLVLAVLAVGGILAGILLQVRAFLFLGFAFLFLDVFTMIWHAAVDQYQTWVWWASGVLLGAAILTLFAIFEKRRQDVLRLLDEIKKWD